MTPRYTIIPYLSSVASYARQIFHARRKVGIWDLVVKPTCCNLAECKGHPTRVTYSLVPHVSDNPVLPSLIEFPIRLG